MTEPDRENATDRPVLLEHSDGVATITLNRPQAMNSLDLSTKQALKQTLENVAADSAVRAVVVTGSGRAFCVGQDLREHADALATQPAERLWSTVPEHFTPIAMLLATMPKPVVAAVNGVAAGAGASIAFACDFRVLAETATFNLAFAGIGLSCDTGASWTLPRLVGVAKAKELLMMPETVTAEQAAALGLATSVVPPDRLSGATAELAGRLAAGPTVAYAAIREAVEFAAAHPLSDALRHEGELMARTGATQDHKDAVAAFIAKQRPVFEGR